MFLVAIVLAAFALLCHVASASSEGWALTVCRYGDVFCAHPAWLAIPALLSFLWAMFLRVDRL